MTASSPSHLLPFTKVEGLGNDFVVVDLRGPQRPAGPSPEDPTVVRAICDRHFGIGADGVLAILPGEHGDARMRVLNADGSEAEMCGNGIRCVAKVLYESDPSMRRPVLRIDTGAGLLECALEVAGTPREVAGTSPAPREVAGTSPREVAGTSPREVAGTWVKSVAVEMGRPRFARDEIPMTPGGRERAVRQHIEARGRSFTFTAVSMGNPHAVIFVDDPGEDLRALAETYGPVLEVAPEFPRRTNVELARVRGSEIDLVVWERGCGITLACGTGACAAAVAASVEERLPAGHETPVHLPGGTLHITVAPEYAGVRMRGPARAVFQASVDLAALMASGR